MRYIIWLSRDKDFYTVVTSRKDGDKDAEKALVETCGTTAFDAYGGRNGDTDTYSLCEWV